MSRRARKASGSGSGEGPSLEKRAADAAEAVARAESALQYRKTQLAEAQDELAGLDGMSGMLLALIGRRGSARAEAEARIRALQSEVLACRTRLIEARQARAIVGREEQSAADARAVRDDELERFAERVRDSHHPLRDALVAVEDEIQEGYDRLADLTDAFRACSGLSASLAEIGRKANRAVDLAWADTYDLPGAQVLGFLKTREIQKDVTTVPEAIERFNSECLKLGLEPLDLQLSRLGTDWSALFVDNILTDLSRLRTLGAYAEEIASIKQIAVETSLWVAGQRTEALAAQEERIQRRRTLLDEALG